MDMGRLLEKTGVYLFSRKVESHRQREQQCQQCSTCDTHVLLGVPDAERYVCELKGRNAELRQRLIQTHYSEPRRELHAAIVVV